LGALARYTSDYPKLRRKFGDNVTYEDNHRGHIRTFTSRV